MSDGYTYTNATNESNQGLTLEALRKVIEDLEAKLPRLLYYSSEYLPLLTKEGGPLILMMTPANEYAAIFERYVAVHPDNLPELRRVCRGRYRLEPLVGARREVNK